MTSRERVLAALNFQETDRVPCDLDAMGSTGISAFAYPKLVKALGLPPRRTRIYDTWQMIAVVDRDVLDALECDCICVNGENCANVLPEPEKWRPYDFNGRLEALVLDPSSFRVLPDGTSIYLNSGSTLRYSNRFNRENRRVELDGEAYFEVTKQAGEQPFAVVTSDYEIVVKGTKFNVSSYAEDPVTTTSLLEGNIDVSRGQERYSVEPGEAVRLDRETGQMSLYRTDAQQSTSWMNGDLVYDRITLRELAARLSRKYDLPIRLDDGLDGETEFRISLRSEESIESVLNALGRIIPVRPVKEGQEIVIKKR